MSVEVLSFLPTELAEAPGERSGGVCGLKPPLGRAGESADDLGRPEQSGERRRFSGERRRFG